MPDTDFFALREDEDRLISMAFDLGLKITPDLMYPSRNICVASSQNAYDKMRTMTSLVFIFSDDLLVSPFQMVEMDHGNEYFIRQRYGGPYVMFLRYLPYDENGMTVLPSSSFSYYSTFYDSVTGERFRPAKEFKALYKVLS